MFSVDKGEIMSTNPEQSRLSENEAGIYNKWKHWGPYLSERSWGTVREDYSANGDSWNYFPHDHARSRAYRWNEDGLGGFCDDKQHLCLAVALWNEKDPCRNSIATSAIRLRWNVRPAPDKCSRAKQPRTLARIIFLFRIFLLTQATAQTLRDELLFSLLGVLTFIVVIYRQ